MTHIRGASAVMMWRRSRSLECTSLPMCSVRRAMASMAFHPTHLRHRPQTIKTNPFESQSGKFDQSFEKLTMDLESRMPLRQCDANMPLHELPFGERSLHQDKQAAQDDLQGTEGDRPAARMARSYFSGEDLSPEALHVRSPRLKVAQHYQRQKYDKKLLKTSNESAEYYYTVDPTEVVWRRRMLCSVGVAATLSAVLWLCGWLG